MSCPCPESLPGSATPPYRKYSMSGANSDGLNGLNLLVTQAQCTRRARSAEQATLAVQVMQDISTCIYRQELAILFVRDGQGRPHNAAEARPSPVAQCPKTARRPGPKSALRAFLARRTQQTMRSSTWTRHGPRKASPLFRRTGPFRSHQSSGASHR